VTQRAAPISYFPFVGFPTEIFGGTVYNKNSRYGTEFQLFRVKGQKTQEQIGARA
jgi:hypothetical protein